LLRSLDRLRVAAAGYARAAPQIATPLFAKMTTVVANSRRLKQLGLGPPAGYARRPRARPRPSARAAMFTRVRFTTAAPGTRGGTLSVLCAREPF